MERVRKSGIRVYLALFGLIFLLLPFSVRAEGNTIIGFSDKDPGVGDQITVTVTGSEADTIQTTYDPSLVEVVSCSAPGASIGGGKVTFQGKTAILTVRTKAAGGAAFVVTGQKLAGCSANLTITAKDPGNEAGGNEDGGNEGDDSQKTAPAAGETDPALAGGDETEHDFLVDGVPMVLSERFRASEIPAGFEKKRMDFPSGSYKELTNGSMVLLYLKPASDIKSPGKFYIYNEKEGSVAPFIKVGSGDHYLIVLKPKKTYSVLSPKSVKIGEGTVEGYGTGDAASSLTYFYGVNEKGEEGWFTYEDSTGSFLRADTALLEKASSPADEGNKTASSEKEEEKEKEKDKSSLSLPDRLLKKIPDRRTIGAILIFAAAVIAIILINVFAFKRRKKLNALIDPSSPEPASDEEIPADGPLEGEEKAEAAASPEKGTGPEGVEEAEEEPETEEEPKAEEGPKAEEEPLVGTDPDEEEYEAILKVSMEEEDKKDEKPSDPSDGGMMNLNNL